MLRTCTCSNCTLQTGDHHSENQFPDQLKIFSADLFPAARSSTRPSLPIPSWSYRGAPARALTGPLAAASHRKVASARRPGPHASEWELQQGRSDGALRSDCEQPGPPGNPRGARSRPHGRLCRSQVAASVPTGLRPQHQRPPSGSGGRAPARGRFGGVCVGRRHQQKASTTCCKPCHKESPFATTSMRPSSETGTSMFMSARRTLRATRAPASWHTLATARSRRRARDASTPDVAHAALWSPRGFKRPRQAHVRGATSCDKQSRRSSRTRKSGEGIVASVEAGKTVKAQTRGLRAVPAAARPKRQCRSLVRGGRRPRGPL